MAITLISTTPYSAVYHIVGTGATETIDYTNAPTLNALAAGPYKAEVTKLLATIAGLAILNLDGNSERVRIYDVWGVNAPLFTPPRVDIHWVGPGLSCTMPGPGEGSPASEKYIEIRFEHSEKR